MKLKYAICLLLSTAALSAYALVPLREGGSLQIFYNNNKSILLQARYCTDRVAYCVNEMLQSAPSQLPQQYTITRINYIGPPPASQQVVTYNKQPLTEGICDENEVFAQALSKQPITNINALRLTYVTASCHNQAATMLRSTPQENTPATISDYAKMLGKIN